MGVGRSILFGVASTWFGRLVRVGLNLALLPVLFSHLSSSELGLWFLLGQSLVFLGLLDFGISFSLTRKIAMASAPRGPAGALTPAAAAEVAAIISGSKRIYLGLSALVMLLGLGGGLLFFGYLDTPVRERGVLAVAWSVLCLGHALNVWAAVWSTSLQGLGLVGWDALGQTLVTVAVLVLQMAAAALGGGLVALAILTSLGALATRYLMKVVVLRHHPEVVAPDASPMPGLLRGILGLSFRGWLTSLGVFVMLRTDQYFVATLSGVSDVPAYSAAYQVVQSLFFLAASLGATSRVFVSRLWSAGRHQEVRAIVLRNMRLALTIMTCGSIGLVLSGKVLFDVWLGPGHYVGTEVLLIFCVMLSLDAQHSIAVSAGRATGDEAYAVSTMVGAVLNVICSLVFFRWWGVAGIAAGTLAAQLATNNWYGLYRAFRRLELGIGEHLTRVVVPVGAAGGATWLLSWLPRLALTGSPRLEALSILALCALIALCFIWRWGLGATERAAILLALRKPFDRTGPGL